MIDFADLHLALRTRLIGVEVCGTGSATLAAVATGYTRASGSFLTDGFRVGMEVTPSGFSDLTTRLVTAVTATTMTVSGAVAPQGASAGRALTAFLPAMRSYDNLAFTPVVGRPYLEEDFAPATTTLLSASADGGRTEATGLYVLRLVGLANTGHLALRAMAQAILARYGAGLGLAVAGGTAYVRGDLAPFSGPIRRMDGGWALLTITIPWRAFGTNAIAA
jgi:hypothetical protein